MKFKILVPLDGSEQSESVFPFLRYLASKLPIEAELFRCYQPPLAIYMTPESAERADNYAYLQQKQAELEGIESTTIVGCGDTVTEILSRAANADMIVMATRDGHEFSKHLLGGVTSKLAGLSPVPVLVVHKSSGSPRMETLLIAVDGSPLAEKVFRKGVELARTLGAKVILYRAVEAQPSARAEGAAYLQALADSCADLKVEMEIHVGWSDGGARIAEYAQEVGADTIVLGTQGGTVLGRLLLGSQAQETLEQSRCSVMLVH